jgi:hypothetical protein
MLGQQISQSWRQWLEPSRLWQGEKEFDIDEIVDPVHFANLECQLSNDVP